MSEPPDEPPSEPPFSGSEPATKLQTSRLLASPGAASEPDWPTLLSDTLLSLDELGEPQMSARTLKPPARALRSIQLGGDDIVLPRHRLRERDASGEGEEADFELLEVLGRGGMGAVHLARQHALARSRGDQAPVARVGQLRRRASSAAARGVRDRGAWSTRDIVPVYSLGMDEQGAPIMVMKRIEGVSWQQALERPELLPRAWRGSSEREHEALLLGHVEIFEQVCLAIHYAHSRGVVHRDLKPENVMLGEHGEVYVVDWGIAVSVDPEEQGFLPLASQERHVVGTPMYMAPEQAAGEGLRISSLTDVYGLGAILHQVITGRMRHEGASLQAVLLRAYASKPHEYAEGIDEELAAICNRACEREPQARFESAAALREALSAWTKRRRGRELLEATLDRLNAFKRLVDLAVASGQATAQQMTRAHALSGACRFGLERAGELLGQDARLERARQELLERMLALEVLHGNLPAARALAEELGPKLSPAGASKLNDLSASLKAEQARIARLEQAVDFRIGRRGRGLFALALGAIWTVSALLMDQVVGEAETLDGLHARAMLYKLLISVMSLAVWAWARGRHSDDGDQPRFAQHVAVGAGVWVGGEAVRVGDGLGSLRRSRLGDGLICRHRCDHGRVGRSLVGGSRRDLCGRRVYGAARAKRGVDLLCAVQHQRVGADQLALVLRTWRLGSKPRGERGHHA